MLEYNTESKIFKAGVSGNEKVSFNDIDAASIVGNNGWNPAMAAGEGMSLAEGDIIVVSSKSEVAMSMIGDNAWYFVPCQHYSADGKELPVYNLSLSYYRKAVFGVKANSKKAANVEVFTSKGDWRKSALLCGDYKEFFDKLFGSKLRVIDVQKVKVTPFVAADSKDGVQYKRGQTVQPEVYSTWKESNVYSFDIVKEDEVAAEAEAEVAAETEAEVAAE